jgi:hypothetical protein
MRSIDPVGAFIRVSGFASPRLRALLDLRRQKLEGDFAPRIVDELVWAGDVALDIGARWGMYTALLAKRVGPPVSSTPSSGIVSTQGPEDDRTRVRERSRPSVRTLRRGRRRGIAHSYGRW